MSFEKVDITASRDVDLENAKLAETLAEDLKFNAGWCSEALSQAYAEIDRMVVALHASEATLKDCQAENDRLTAMLDQLRGKQAEQELVWKCPVSFKDGEYHWDGSRIRVGDLSFYTHISLRIIRDWTDPPRVGVWRVTEPGKAVWVRE